jgi:hypothetical protein
MIHSFMKLSRTVSLTKFCWLYIFAELTTISLESEHSAEVMDDTLIVFSQEYEKRGLNFQLNREGTNSNGHGGEKEEEINLAETIRKFQTDVQSHKDDNKRLMKAKERHEDFNMKLI